MIGWVDVSSSLFTDITDKCVGVIYPSCSEGGGGSVINCMHAGLIPIVSYESSVDIDDFGIYLNNCSVEEIKRSVRMVSNQSAEKLKKMSRKAWDFARTNHTRDRFAKEYRKVIEKLQNNSRKQKKGKSH